MHWRQGPTPFGGRAPPKPNLVQKPSNGGRAPLHVEAGPRLYQNWYSKWRMEAGPRSLWRQGPADVWPSPGDFQVAPIVMFKGQFSRSLEIFWSRDKSKNTWELSESIGSNKTKNRGVIVTDLLNFSRYFLYLNAWILLIWFSFVYYGLLDFSF